MTGKAMKAAFYLLMTILFGLNSLSTYADCYTNTGGASSQSMNVTPANMVVQKDVPVGQVIGTYTTNTSNVVLSCGNSGDDWGGYWALMVMFTEATNYPNFYETNIPGVAVSLGTTWYFSSPAAWIANNYERSIAFSPRTVTFIKTGDITSGTMSTGILARIYGNGDKASALIYYLIGPVVTQIGCSIRTPNLTFPIGDILAANFGTSIGFTPSGAQSTQELGLNCDAGANINVTLNGTQNPDVSTTSVLALTGQGNADVAQGVGVQLLYNGAPLELNKRITLKQSSGGQETFPIMARYYQTKTVVATGKANASATLDLTYQ